MRQTAEAGSGFVFLFCSMISFKAPVERFGENGEKTGWTYIRIPADIATQLKPGNKKSFRVKGSIDGHAIKGVALIPVGEGDFIMGFNAALRKLTGKRKGATVTMKLEEDKDLLQPPAELLECLADEPEAKSFFESLTYGHKNYFTKWIESAKTEPTRIKRIAQAVNALGKHQDFGTMLRSSREAKPE